ncbi:histidine kinase [Granulicella sp. WH15]|nr:histidine kinase [Granulicella sp. WH15]
MRLWLLLFWCVILPRLEGQVVPMPYTPVPPVVQDLPSPPASSSVPLNEPKTVIRGWSSGSELDSALRHEDEISLDPSHSEIVFFFATASHADSPVEFRYRLYGSDSDWTVTDGRVAHYRRLAPGRYRFEVQARTKGEPWGGAVAVLDVQQRPFFYQTWYFYTLLCLCLVALAGQLLSQRDQLLKGQIAMVLEERNRIASDCHDTLMAGFAAISWQLEATAKLFRDAGAAENPAAQSCELARSMVAHCQAEARRIIWDLRDSQEVTNILSQALLRAMSTHRLHERVGTNLDVQGDEIPLPPGAVHHLVCIGQEAVTNAIRHAESSNIHVSLRYDNESLKLLVRDDGRGFDLTDQATRNGHFGILVMDERARKLGGVLHITTSAGSGTEVAVTVSFKAIHQPPHQQHFVVPWIGV